MSAIFWHSKAYPCVWRCICRYKLILGIRYLLVNMGYRGNYSRILSLYSTSLRLNSTIWICSTRLGRRSHKHKVANSVEMVLMERFIQVSFRKMWRWNISNNSKVGVFSIKSKDGEAIVSLLNRKTMKFLIDTTLQQSHRMLIIIVVSLKRN